MYKLHWFIVIEKTTFGGYIRSVFGGALREDAEKRAKDIGGELVHIGAYGMPFSAGEKWPYAL